MLPLWISLFLGSLESTYALLFKTSKISEFESAVVILSHKEEGPWSPKWANMELKASQTAKINQNRVDFDGFRQYWGPLNILSVSMRFPKAK